MEKTSIRQSHILQHLKSDFKGSVDLYTADMSYVWADKEDLVLDLCPYMLNSKRCKPCWSLSGLLKLLPSEIKARHKGMKGMKGYLVDTLYFQLSKDILDTDIIGKKVEPYEVYKAEYKTVFTDPEKIILYIGSNYAINPVDACVEVIEKLYKNWAEDNIVDVIL